MHTSDETEYVPTIREIHDVFNEEITSLGGVVSDVFDDGVRLLARSVLPADADVRPGDTLNAGVALRATASEIAVHPYTFRQVCRNGAIAAHVLQSRRLERTVSSAVVPRAYEGAVTLLDVRNAVRSCASRDVFAGLIEEMQSASERLAEFMLHVLPALRQLPEHGRAEILMRFTRDRDRTVFGVMNAVTSFARDTRDAGERWDLEELGGTLPAWIMIPSPRMPAAALLNA